MIAELFYPKELKDIITDLRAKGDLNEDALDRVNGDSLTKRLVLIILAGVSIVASFYVSDDVVSILLKICSIFFLLLSFLPVPSINRFIMPYVCGVQTTADVVSSFYELIPYHGHKGWCIRYEFFDQKGHKHKGIQGGISRSDVKNGEINAGDDIEVFYLSSKPSANAPFLKSQHRKFFIRKWAPL